MSRREATAAAALATVAAAAILFARWRARRNNRVETLVRRVAALTEQSDDFKEKVRKKRHSMLHFHHRWFCNIKGEGCHMVKGVEDAASPLQPNEDRRRWRCKACDYDSCAACLEVARQAHAHELVLQELPSPEQYAQRRETRRQELAALRASEEACRAELVVAERELVVARHADALRRLLNETAEHAWAADRALLLTERATAARALREVVRQSCALVETAREALDDVVEEEASSSRKAVLVSLPELIGPRPLIDWRDEWVALTNEWAELTGQAHLKKWLNHQREPSECVATHRAGIDASVALGWAEEEAIAYWLLQARVKALSRSLRERDSCYASSLYPLAWPVLAAVA